MTDTRTLLEALKDTADALESRMTAKELATKCREPYDHPLSALDRARDILKAAAEEAAEPEHAAPAPR